jgi:hypothetical protein
VNIPAFGATLLKPRVRKAAIALIGDIAEEALEGRNRLKERRPTEVLTPALERDVVGAGAHRRGRLDAGRWFQGRRGGRDDVHALGLGA